jgi:hypothetical protein
VSEEEAARIAALEARVAALERIAYAPSLFEQALSLNQQGLLNGRCICGTALGVPGATLPAAVPDAHGLGCPMRNQAR